MKNNFKKRFISIILMAIMINMFSGFTSTVNANHTSSEPTETIENSVLKTEEPITELLEVEPIETQIEVATEIKDEPTENLNDKIAPSSPNLNEEDEELPTEVPPTEEPKMGKVVVEHNAGLINLSTETYEGEIGTSYKIEAKDFPGYKFSHGYGLEGTYSEDVNYAYLEYLNEEIDIEVHLHLWDYDNSENLRPDSVTLVLFRNGVAVKEQEEELTPGIDYPDFILEDKYPRFDENGNEYEYTIQIKGFPKEYYINFKYLLKDQNVYIFEFSSQLILENWNIHIYKTFYTDIPTESLDYDENIEIPTEVTMHLLRDGVEVEGSPFVLNDGNDWNIMFYDMPRFDEDGNEYEYTVVEEPVKGFSPIIDKNVYSESKEQGNLSFGVVNILAKDVTATKVWVNGPEVKPDVKFQLYQVRHCICYPTVDKGKVPYGEPIVLKDGETSYTWENLPLSDYKDYVFDYIVEEVEVPEGYTASYSEDKLTITNTYNGENPSPEDVTGETVDVEGTKSWDDNGNKAGKRPESITVNLMADGIKIDSKVVTAEDNWKYGFYELPKTKDDKEIEYTITEDEVKGYTTDIVGYDITNTSIEESIVNPDENREIKGTKTWDDNKDKEGKRPESITVNLMADGIKIDSVKVTAKDDWKYSFKDLEVEKDGGKIVYTISENTVKDYKVSFEGANITNKYVGEVEKNKLPKTGIVALTGITALGVALVALGGYTTFKKKK